MFLKGCVLKNFAIFTGKNLCWSLFFNKVASLKTYNFIKKRLQHEYFHVNIAQLLRAASFMEHLRWLLLHLKEYDYQIPGITKFNYSRCLHQNHQCNNQENNRYGILKFKPVIMNTIVKRITITEFWNLNMLPKDVKRSKKNQLQKECTCFTSKKIPRLLFSYDSKKSHSRKL